MHETESSDSLLSLSRHDNDVIIDDEGEMKKWVRPDFEFHRFIQRLTESNWFNGIIMFTIVVNALTMAVETGDVLKAKYRTAFVTCDGIFLGVYTTEFILKIYAEPIKYFFSAYNLFDFLVLIISFVQIFFGQAQTTSQGPNLNALRTLRALRSLRTLRTVSFVKGLQVLVNALVDTFRNSVFNVVLFLMLLMFLFAIMGYYFFGYRDDMSDKEHWGNLAAAMLTLFTFVTVEGWTDIQADLDKQTELSRVYTILFIILGHFIFTNIFIGMIITNIHEATKAYQHEQMVERELTIQRKKEYMIRRQHEEVRQMLEKQSQGNYKDFYDMVKEFQETLRHDDYTISMDLATSLQWIEAYITTLDHEENTMYRLQQLHFEMCNLLAMVLEQKLEKRYGL